MAERDEEALRIVIAGGGTGGHLFPGIAVARELIRRVPSASVTFAGTERGLETSVVPREGFVLDRIRSAGLKGKSLAAVLRGLALLPLSALDAWRLVSRRKPQLVIGVGGYSSGPVVLTAWLRGSATLILEQNAVPGLANRLLARVVDAAAVTWEETLGWFRAKGFVSGNPVRAGFFAAAAGDPSSSDAGIRVLVFGGSQGAHAINTALLDAAPRLRAASPPIRLTHQTGERDVETVRLGYRQAGLDARVEPFLHDMDREMAAADLLVCRAGATTLAELTAAGKPAILVPLPTATDDHQRKNAEALARVGGAEVIPQRELTGERLANAVVALARDPERRQAMARAARLAARPDAARLIVDRALALVAARSGRSVA